MATLPASVQKRDTLPALNHHLPAWPSLRLAIFEGAFAADMCRAWANFHGMRHQVVSRTPDQKGFVVLARRWVFERSFGWLTPWGGLLRCRAGRFDVAAGCLAFVAGLSRVQALLNPHPCAMPHRQPTPIGSEEVTVSIFNDFRAVCGDRDGPS